MEWAAAVSSAGRVDDKHIDLLHLTGRISTVAVTTHWPAKTLA